MVGSEPPLNDGHGALEVGPGGGQLALVLLQRGQVVEALGVSTVAHTPGVPTTAPSPRPSVSPPTVFAPGEWLGYGDRTDAASGDGHTDEATGPGQEPNRYFPLAADLQAAATVIGRCADERREEESKAKRSLNLRGVTLPRAILSGAHLQRPT